MTTTEATTQRERFRAVCGTRRYTTFESEQLGKVWIRSLTEYERMEIEWDKVANGNDPEDIKTRAGYTTANLIVGTVCNSDHKLLFGPDDVEWLAEMDTAYASPLRDAINAHVEPPDDKAAKKN